ncbi:MAG TPA: NBR1-Ig-like domain-containing protein, partial [Kofleriaceae bacterium]|nr:NBR1-Ig-like domain-containing protein [Kofleriaceae bacterium]
MMRRLGVVVALLCPTPALATEAGLDVGRIVDNATLHHNNESVDSTGTPWIRLNLRLDDWSAPDDDTKRGPDQLTWYETYDRIVDDYLTRGIQVYALINDEAVYSTQPYGSDAWIADYVQNAVKIVDHFKNRIRVYEIINEPNDWAGGSTSRFSPRAYAKILQDTYLAVKHDAGHIDDRCWQVQLVSGPLFSFDDNSSAEYLQQAYSIGKSQLAWDYTHAETGSYPLDGIGYHMYVAQGLDSSSADVRTQMLASLGAMWNVVTSYEGTGTGKRIWVSEYGWEAGVVGDAVQAERMQAGFSAMNEFGKVALALYFNFQDFPGASYGVFDAANQPRPSATTMKSLAPPTRRARIVGINMPALAPGALGDATIILENRGTTTWTDEFRLASAPGCPEAATANAIAWEPTAGYSNGILDARVLMPHAVGPGETIEIHVPVRAPAEPGEYAFAARMVHEGVEWFGPTVSAVVTVAAGNGSGDGSGSGSDDGDHTASGGGCSTGHGSSVWLVVALG